ncbi:MAG TPA: TetR/AcrR family transcriptional regulator [Mycobacterium sp.]|nr:TetR/AcrR family transcriptional regulator [Mycobacterium sp.]
MARQVRSEATRRKLLDAAIEVFSEVGYAAAGRVAIVERAGTTKGALYHHFDSMNQLVTAIIDEGSETLLAAFRSMCPPSSPALEGLIHGIFAAADALVCDKRARVATHLALALDEFNDAAVGVHARWLQEVAAQTQRAIAEGDLRGDLDPRAVGEAIVGAVFGARSLSEGDPVGRLTRMWELLLPAIVMEPALPYFRQFLARETLRH